MSSSTQPNLQKRRDHVRRIFEAAEKNGEKPDKTNGKSAGLRNWLLDEAKKLDLANDHFSKITDMDLMELWVDVVESSKEHLEISTPVSASSTIQNSQRKKRGIKQGCPPESKTPPPQPPQSQSSEHTDESADDRSTDDDEGGQLPSYDEDVRTC
jgi:hypothetical protein